MAAFNVVDAGTGEGVELARTEGNVVTKGARLVLGWCLGMGLVEWCKDGLKVVEYCRKAWVVGCCRIGFGVLGWTLHGGV